MESKSDHSTLKITRRDLLVQGSTLLVCATALPYDAFGQAEEQVFVEVKTKYGRLRGGRDRGVAIFKGVPYAGSVSGANRFKAAPPLKPWTGVRDALRLAAPAPQSGRAASDREPAPAEECLFLNVWTPGPFGRKRPVMFYSHGGGFTSGSGGSAYQDGANLARTWDVVVVASNHRLGLMGYLYLGDLAGEEYSTSGNQGMLDIRDALKWVHENIESFGGDPDNVMIFGESGGGGKTSCLYAMPSAAPCFNKASIESGPGIRMMPRAAAAETTLMLLKRLGLEKSDWRKLLDMPLDELVTAQGSLGQGGGPLTRTGGRKGMTGGDRPGGFGPIVDGVVLPKHPFDPEAPAISKNKPLIVGYNRDETVFFLQRNTEAFNLTEAALKERLAKEFAANSDTVYETYRKARPDASPSEIYIAITTANMIGIGAVTIAERKYAQHGAPVFMYIFAHEAEGLIPGTNMKRGSPHAMEIPYKFNIVQPAGAQSGRGGGMSVSGPEAEKAAHNMSEMWSTFARTGRPAATGQPEWPAYDTRTRATMEIKAECKVLNDPFGAERAMWERLDV
jgi:para-nitrobenzyl esterase